VLWPNCDSSSPSLRHVQVRPQHALMITGAALESAGGARALVVPFNARLGHCLSIMRYLLIRLMAFTMLHVEAFEYHYEQPFHDVACMHTGHWADTLYTFIVCLHAFVDWWFTCNAFWATCLHSFVNIFSCFPRSSMPGWGSELLPYVQPPPYIYDLLMTHCCLHWFRCQCVPLFQWFHMFTRFTFLAQVLGQACY
jgi:hypothetical protein